MSVGMTKFYRRACFDQIGGFVREVMWDAIDCHKARQMGWIAVSWDDPDLRFEHLRPMGSSEVSIHEGRRRHGRGQWFMGSDPLFYLATCAFRMAEPPYVTRRPRACPGLQGYVRVPGREARASLTTRRSGPSSAPTSVVADNALRVGKARRRGGDRGG
jgi:hypothetical protein